MSAGARPNSQTPKRSSSRASYSSQPTLSYLTGAYAEKSPSGYESENIDKRQSPQPEKTRKTKGKCLKYGSEGGYSVTTRVRKVIRTCRYHASVTRTSVGKSLAVTCKISSKKWPQLTVVVDKNKKSSNGPEHPLKYTRVSTKGDGPYDKVSVNGPNNSDNAITSTSAMSYRSVVAKAIGVDTRVSSTEKQLRSIARLHGYGKRHSLPTEQLLNPIAEQGNESPAAKRIEFPAKRHPGPIQKPSSNKRESVQTTDISRNNRTQAPSHRAVTSQSPIRSSDCKSNVLDRPSSCVSTHANKSGCLSNTDTVLTSNTDTVLTSNTDTVLTSNTDTNTDTVLTSNTDTVLTSYTDTVLASNTDTVLTSNTDTVLTSKVSKSAATQRSPTQAKIIENTRLSKLKTSTVNQSRSVQVNEKKTPERQPRHSSAITNSKNSQLNVCIAMKESHSLPTLSKNLDKSKVKILTSNAHGEETEQNRKRPPSASKQVDVRMTKAQAMRAESIRVNSATRRQHPIVYAGTTFSYTHIASVSKNNTHTRENTQHLNSSSENKARKNMYCDKLGDVKMNKAKGIRSTSVKHGRGESCSLKNTVTAKNKQTRGLAQGKDTSHTPGKKKGNDKDIFSKNLQLRGIRCSGKPYRSVEMRQNTQNEWFETSALSIDEQEQKHQNCSKTLKNSEAVVGGNDCNCTIPSVKELRKRSDDGKEHEDTLSESTVPLKPVVVNEGVSNSSSELSNDSYSDDFESIYETESIPSPRTGGSSEQLPSKYDMITKVTPQAKVTVFLERQASPRKSAKSIEADRDGMDTEEDEEVSYEEWYENTAVVETPPPLTSKTFSDKCATQATDVGCLQVTPRQQMPSSLGSSAVTQSSSTSRGTVVENTADKPNVQPTKEEDSQDDQQKVLDLSLAKATHSSSGDINDTTPRVKATASTHVPLTSELTHSACNSSSKDGLVNPPADTASLLLSIGKQISSISCTPRVVVPYTSSSGSPDGGEGRPTEEDCDTGLVSSDQCKSSSGCSSLSETSLEDEAGTSRQTNLTVRYIRKSSRKKLRANIEVDKGRNAHRPLVSPRHRESGEHNSTEPRTSQSQDQYITDMRNALSSLTGQPRVTDAIRSSAVSVSNDTAASDSTSAEAIPSADKMQYLYTKTPGKPGKMVLSKKTRTHKSNDEYNSDMLATSGNVSEDTRMIDASVCNATPATPCMERERISNDNVAGVNTTAGDHTDTMAPDQKSQSNEKNLSELKDTHVAVPKETHMAAISRDNKMARHIEKSRTEPKNIPSVKKHVCKEENTVISTISSDSQEANIHHFDKPETIASADEMQYFNKVIAEKTETITAATCNLTMHDNAEDIIDLSHHSDGSVRLPNISDTSSKSALIEGTMSSKKKSLSQQYIADMRNALNEVSAEAFMAKQESSFDKNTQSRTKHDQRNALDKLTKETATRSKSTGDQYSVECAQGRSSSSFHRREVIASSSTTSRLSITPDRHSPTKQYMADALNAFGVVSTETLVTKREANHDTKLPYIVRQCASASSATTPRSTPITPRLSTSMVPLPKKTASHQYLADMGINPREITRENLVAIKGTSIDRRLPIQAKLPTKHVSRRRGDDTLDPVTPDLRVKTPLYYQKHTQARVLHKEFKTVTRSEATKANPIDRNVYSSDNRVTKTLGKDKLKEKVVDPSAMEYRNKLSLLKHRQRKKTSKAPLESKMVVSRESNQPTPNDGKMRSSARRKTKGRAKGTITTVGKVKEGLDLCSLENGTHASLKRNKQLPPQSSIVSHKSKPVATSESNKATPTENETHSPSNHETNDLANEKPQCDVVDQDISTSDNETPSIAKQETVVPGDNYKFNGTGVYPFTMEYRTRANLTTQDSSNVAADDPGGVASNESSKVTSNDIEVHSPSNLETKHHEDAVDTNSIEQNAHAPLKHDNKRPSSVASHEIKDVDSTDSKPSTDSEIPSSADPETTVSAKHNSFYGDDVYPFTMEYRTQVSLKNNIHEPSDVALIEAKCVDSTKSDKTTHATSETPALANLETKAFAESETSAQANLETKAPVESKTSAPDNLETKAPVESKTSAQANLETKAVAESETLAQANLETKAPAESETLTPTNLKTKASTESEMAAPTNLKTKAPVESETPAPANLETKASAEIKMHTAATLKTKASVESKTSKPSASIESKIEAPANLKTKAHVESKKQAPAKLKTKTHVESKIQTPANLKTKAPVESKIQAPANLKTKAPVESKIQTPANLKTKAPVESKIQAPTKLKTKAPIESRIQTPANLKTKAPVESKKQAPANLETKAHAESKKQAPANLKIRTPVESKIQAPANLKTKVPVESKIQAPANLETKASAESKKKAPTNLKIKFPVESKMEAPANLKTKAPLEIKSQTPANPETKAPVQSKKQAPANLQTKAPVLSKLQSPANLKTKAPVESKIQAPANLRTKVPVESKIQAPANLKTKVPVESKMEAPANLKTKAPLEIKSQTPANLKTKAPVESKIQAPANLRTKVPVESKIQAPANLKTKVPVESKIQAPANLKTKAPLEIKSQTPANPETKAPVQSKLQSPANLKTKAPVESKIQAPANLKTKVPVVSEMEAPTYLKTKARLESKMEAQANLKIRAPVESKIQATANLKTKVPVESKIQAPANLKIKVPVERKMKAPANLKTKAPVESKIQAPANLKTKVPVESKIQAPANLETKASAESKKQAQANLKIKVPVESKIQAPANLKTKVPVESKIQAPANLETKASAESKKQAPANLNIKVPVESKIEASANLKTKVPVESKIQTPANLETKVPVESKIQAPANLKIKVPVESKIQAPAILETKASAESKKQAPANLKIKVPVESKIEASANLKIRAPVESKIQAPANLKTKVPVESKIQAPANLKTKVPVESKIEASANLKTKVPVESKIEASANLKTKVPVESKIQAPANLETKASAESKKQAPANLQTKAPVQSKSQSPANLKTKAPVQSKAQAPTNLKTKAYAESETPVPADMEIKAAAENMIRGDVGDPTTVGPLTRAGLKHRHRRLSESSVASQKVKTVASIDSNKAVPTDGKMKSATKRKIKHCSKESLEHARSVMDPYTMEHRARVALKHIDQPSSQSSVVSNQSKMVTSTESNNRDISDRKMTHPTKEATHTHHKDKFDKNVARPMDKKILTVFERNTSGRSKDKQDRGKVKFDDDIVDPFTMEHIMQTSLKRHIQRQPDANSSPDQTQPSENTTPPHTHTHPTTTTRAASGRLLKSPYSLATISIGDANTEHNVYDEISDMLSGLKI